MKKTIIQKHLLFIAFYHLCMSKCYKYTVSLEKSDNAIPTDCKEIGSNFDNKNQSVIIHPHYCHIYD